MLNEIQHQVSAKANGKRYLLQVSLPKGYGAASGPCPTLYLLDGRLTFPIAASTRALLDLPGALDRVIVIGLIDVLDDHEYAWNASRWLDYSPSHDADRDARNTVRYGMPADLPLQSGGGAAFLMALRKDIIPFVDAHYRTSADRGIAGHSMGGVFALYALAMAPDLFNRFGILSPTTWNDGEPLRLLAEQAKFLPASPRVLITWGSQEAPASIRAAQEAADWLRRTLRPTAPVQVQVFEGEGHHSVVAGSVSRVLTQLYPPTPAPTPTR